MAEEMKAEDEKKAQAEQTALEAKKAEALAAEDFDQAKELNAEITVLKQTPPPETPKVSLKL